MSAALKQATPRQVRAHYRGEGFECRISRDGSVRFREDRDRHPSRSKPIWQFGGWVNYYQWSDELGEVVS